MAYLVRIARRAERDLAAIYAQIEASSSIAAATWFRRLRKAILSLEEMPKRCPSTPENTRLLQLLYGRKPNVYRVIFRVRERAKRVEVLHIRHGARTRFTRADF